MQQQVGFTNLQHALSCSDPFALALVEHFPHSMDMVNRDMTLIAEAYQSLSRAVHDIDLVRHALAAAGRLQGIALLLQSGLTYQHYSFYVETFTRYLDDLDRYLRTLPRY